MQPHEDGQTQQCAWWSMGQKLRRKAKLLVQAWGLSDHETVDGDSGTLSQLPNEEHFSDKETEELSANAEMQVRGVSA